MSTERKWETIKEYEQLTGNVIVMLLHPLLRGK